jgi:hypothetical protein
MDWNQAVGKVTPYLVKIETPTGHGTGYLCLYCGTNGNDFCGIATAHHVVEHADKWQQPIRIRHQPTNGVALLKETERFIFLDGERDSAVILAPSGNLKLPESLIPLRPIADVLSIGDEVGWLGYPALGRDTDTLCFFSGNISARRDLFHAYLIDGVAINGVSGGPVISLAADGSPQIVGTIAAYIVNRATGEALPGLSVAQDLSHLHDTVSEVKSIDDANRKKLEQEQQAKDSSSDPETPSN